MHFKRLNGTAEQHAEKVVVRIRVCLSGIPQSLTEGSRLQALCAEASGWSRDWFGDTYGTAESGVL